MIAALSLSNAAGQIVAPSLGRPAFAPPGGTIRAIVESDSGEPKKAELVGRDSSIQRYLLDVVPSAGEATAALSLQIPDDIPEGVYDLELTPASGTPLRAIHGVAVRQLRGPLRIVHLSDFRLGDPCAPRFDPRLIAEINLIAPDLVVLTGDLVDSTASNGSSLWTEATENLARLEAPLFAAVGPNDDLAAFSANFSISPTGESLLGRFRFAAIYDAPHQPFANDLDQQRWLQALVSDASVPTIVVGGTTMTALQFARLPRGAASAPLWFTGTDEPSTEAPPQNTFATHAATPRPTSAAPATGRYRIVEVDPSATRNPTSRALTQGSFSADADGPNDGSRNRVLLRLCNRTAEPERLSCKVRVRKSGDHRPWVQGGALARLVDFGDFWECSVRVLVPDRGGATIAVGAADPSSPTPVSAEWHDAAAGIVTLKNRGNAPIEVQPLIRTAGRWISWTTGEHSDRQNTEPIALPAGGECSLRLNAAAFTFDRGARMYVYPFGRDGSTILTLPLQAPSTRPPTMKPGSVEARSPTKPMESDAADEHR